MEIPVPNLGYFGKIWEQFFIHRSTVIFLLVPSIFPFSIGPVLLAIAGVYCGIWSDVLEDLACSSDFHQHQEN